MNLIDFFGVAPAGVSGAYCRSCKQFLSFAELVELTRKNNHCNYCFETIHVDSIGVSFQYDAEVFVKEPAQILKTSWFHATQKTNWLESINDAGVVAHVGTKRSAIQRSIDLTRRSFIHDSPWFIHKLTIASFATVNNFVEYDLDDDAVRTVEELHANHFVDVVRYLNMYEDCGSVSLIVNPNLLMIVDTQIVSNDDLYSQYLTMQTVEV